MDKKTDLPLEGITVLELANVLAGPSVGMFMAELGAQVLKVENVKSSGDVTRHWKLSTEDPKTDISAYFSCVNWGKKSLALDLSTDEGLEIIYDIARKSDVVLVSYKPGDAEKLKVDYPGLKEINPDIIFAHVTGYGLMTRRAGYDAIIQAESGFTYMNGEPEGNPVKMPVALMDVLAAHQLKEAILLALWSRERHGGGQYIESSLYKSGVASLANQATNWLVGEAIPKRMGSDHPNIVPYGTIFRTADDKEIVLAVGTDKQFRELCKLLGKPELADDKRFEKNQERVKNSGLIKSLLQELIGKYTREDILEKMSEKAVPAGGVYNMKEVFETAHAQEMLFEEPLNSGTIKGVRSVSFTCDNIASMEKLSRPPRYGEHTRDILSGLLGLEDDRIEGLINKGVIYAK